MTARDAAALFPHPPDDPVTLGITADEVRRRSTIWDDGTDGLLRIRATAADHWTGPTAEAAGTHLTRTARGLDGHARTLGSAAAALDRCTATVEDARAQIDTIRAEDAQVAALDAAFTRDLADGVITPATLPGRLRTVTAAQGALRARYTQVMRTVSVEAAATSATLLAGSGAEDDGGVREDPNDRILREYQVEDDEMVEWLPSGLNGLLARMAGRFPAGPFDVTAGEAEMLDGLNPIAASQMEKLRDEAFAEADRRYPPPDGQQNDNHNDAFRHAYWDALMSEYYGRDWTERYTIAHEQRPGNPSVREAMDLYNNEVGRNVDLTPPVGTLYRESLADQVDQALKDGKLLVVDIDGRLRWSDEVEVGVTPSRDLIDDLPPLKGHDPQDLRDTTS